MKKLISLSVFLLALLALTACGNNCPHESLAHVEEKSATCEQEGSREHWYCADCDSYFLNAEGTRKTNRGSVYMPKEHNAFYVPEVPNTCTVDGVKEHYECATCGKYWHDSATGDSDGVPFEDLILHAFGHPDLSYAGHKTPDCFEEGYKDHYICRECNKMYADADATIELDSVKLDKLPHDLTHVERKESTCTEFGNIEYYHCENCNLEFEDAEGTTMLEGGYTINPKGHSCTQIPGKLATCTEDGNKTYYHCEDCDKYFWSSVGMDEITDLSETIFKAPGHNFEYNDEVQYTCEKNGMKAHAYCKDCQGYYAQAPGGFVGDKVTYESLIIETPGHEWTNDYNYAHDDTHHWRVCAKCLATKDKAEHTIGANNTCTVCKNAVVAPAKTEE